MSLEDYLKQHYTEATVAAYKREITAYVYSCKGACKAQYADIVSYLGRLRERYPNPSTIQRISMAIKAYYAYLCFAGKRKDNPAKSIRLRDKKSRDIQLQDLFTEEELEKLLERRDTHNALSYRNKVLAGLLIYQALQPREMELVQVTDIDLSTGSIRIRATPKTNTRTLQLRSHQVMLLHEYIQDIRPKLLAKQDIPPSGELKGAELLLIGERGNAMPREDITKHVKRSYKGLYGRRIVNCQTIRQSVITNLLKKGTDLRVVQVFAGHKWASTTERYKQSDVDALKAAVVKYHPFA